MALAIVDIFEAPGIAEGLARHSIQVTTANLVPSGVGDIFWYGHNGVRFSLEHKTVSELPSVIGRRLDTQLRKHSNNADDVGLVIEGVITPTPDGGIQMWKYDLGRLNLVRGRVSKLKFHALMAYLWRIQKEGFSVYFFADQESLCLAVAGFITNSLKPEHSTLRGYGTTKKIDWVPNPHVASLLGIFSGYGKVPIGEVTAKRIIDKYKTPWAFFNAHPDDVTDVISRDLFLGALSSLGKKEF